MMLLLFRETETPIGSPIGSMCWETNGDFTRSQLYKHFCVYVLETNGDFTRSQLS